MGRLIPTTAQHNTAQHNTAQHNTTQHNTTQHNTTQHNTTQHNTTQHNTTQHNTTQHNTTQHNTTHDTTQPATIQTQPSLAQHDATQRNGTHPAAQQMVVQARAMCLCQGVRSQCFQQSKAITSSRFSCLILFDPFCCGAGFSLTIQTSSSCILFFCVPLARAESHFAKVFGGALKIPVPTRNGAAIIDRFVVSADLPMEVPKSAQTQTSSVGIYVFCHPFFFCGFVAAIWCKAPNKPQHSV